MDIIAQYLTPAFAASVVTLFLKWCLDLITSKRQYTRDRKKFVLLRQIEMMENAMANQMEMWEAYYSLKSIMERFSAEPSPAQIELLQKAINDVNRLQEKSNGSTKIIPLYYDFTNITKEYELEKIDKILLDLSDVISRTFARINKLKLEGGQNELLQVESEHVANSYHLYAQAIDCKMKSIQTIQEYLRKEFKKLK